MKYKDYEALIEYSEKDDTFVGKIIGIQDLITFDGKSVSEIRKSFHEAVDDYLDYCEEIGKEPAKPYKGVFNVRTTPDLHAQLARIARHENLNLNAVVNKALEMYCDSYHSKNKMPSEQMPKKSRSKSASYFSKVVQR